MLVCKNWEQEQRDLRNQKLKSIIQFWYYFVSIFYLGPLVWHLAEDISSCARVPVLEGGLSCSYTSGREPLCTRSKWSAYSQVWPLTDNEMSSWPRTGMCWSSWCQCWSRARDTFTIVKNKYFISEILRVSSLTRSLACHCTWSLALWTWHPWGPAYTPARSQVHKPQFRPTPGNINSISGCHYDLLYVWNASHDPVHCHTQWQETQWCSLSPLLEHAPVLIQSGRNSFVRGAIKVQLEIDGSATDCTNLHM